jgi:hypothetical protein
MIRFLKWVHNTINVFRFSVDMGFSSEAF